MSPHIHMLGLLPFLRFLAAEGQPGQGLPEMVPKEMPCPTVRDTTPLRGDQVRELGALKRVTVLLEAKRKRLSADQHTRFTGNARCHADVHIQTFPGVLRAEWMGANGALLDRTDTLTKKLFRSGRCDTSAYRSPAHSGSAAFNVCPKFSILIWQSHAPKKVCNIRNELRFKQANSAVTDSNKQSKRNKIVFLLMRGEMFQLIESLCNQF